MRYLFVILILLTACQGQRSRLEAYYKDCLQTGRTEAECRMKRAELRAKMDSGGYVYVD